MEDRIKALSTFLDMDVELITESSYDEKSFETEEGEYLVLTDSEADYLASYSIDNYIEECVLSEIPEPYRNYFDNEAFKSDILLDGRGIQIASYDHEENEIMIEGFMYFIYRTN